ncbi:acetyl-CoA hydrolase, partial [Reticulomyxa filosa]
KKKKFSYFKKKKKKISPEYSAHFRDNSLFIGGNLRNAVNSGLADFTPIFLSEIPRLFQDPDYKLDVALLQVSPPDKHGFCSLGTSVDCTRAAILAAKYVVGLVNKNVPRTHGDGQIHISHFQNVVHHDTSLPEIKAGGEVDEAADKIDSVLKNLTHHKDIGIHTEMCSDGMLHLVNSGVISNSYKYQHRGKTVSSFCMGSKKLYDFINDNPSVLFFDCSYVNDVGVIRSNDRVHAINSCIEAGEGGPLQTSNFFLLILFLFVLFLNEKKGCLICQQVDITGQVCADSIGTRMYSGVGGQMDFMRGASLSKEGKAIMAFSSTTGKGQSKIVPTLKQGSGVVTTRAHVQYVVTEYGFAKLYGKSLRERAKLLINLAHPDHRESLEKAAVERFGKLDLD